MLEDSPLELLMIAKDPDLAAEACDAGVTRIFMDLERLGKAQRQEGLNLPLSDHQLADVVAMRPRVAPGTLMVRVDPIHDESKDQIHEVLSAGADQVMLPMFTSRQEVARFVEIVDGRAKTVLLLETKVARDNIDDILAVNGIDEIHVGLNDLSMQLGMPFLFQVLAEGVIDELAPKVRAAGVRFGFGGVGRMGGHPLPGELIIGEHKRVGSEMVILSRVFHGNSKTLRDLREKNIDMRLEISRLRDAEAHALQRSAEQVESDTRELRRIVRKIVEERSLHPVNA